MPRKRTGVWLIRKGKRALKCKDVNNALIKAKPGDVIQSYETTVAAYRATCAPRISVFGVMPKGKR